MTVTTPIPVPNPMNGPNKMKLGVFSANAAGGLALTTVPERWAGNWHEILAVTKMADRAGFEFILPLARWLGFGGATNSRLHSFESLTHGAALAAATDRIAIFSTVHTPFVHPVFAAKSMTTIDHVSGGRAGLNIVCGWNEPEYAVFGVKKQKDVYALGYEWFEIFSRIVAGEGPFDYAGEYFDLKGVIGQPRTVQQPRPVVLSAAFSPTGRDFAAQTSDYIFTVFDDFESGARHMIDIRDRAGRYDRTINACTTCHVVCRETQAEADDYYEWFAVTNEDKAAVDRHMAMKKEMSGSHDASAYELYRKRFAAGAGSFPLVGTPERLVADMQKLYEIGFTGVAATFVNYLEELPFFIERVLPLMREAGLREQ
jgi:FMNH2-dependent dimethyl sulfone monooxygenase